MSLTFRIARQVLARTGGEPESLPRIFKAKLKSGAVTIRGPMAREVAAKVLEHYPKFNRAMSNDRFIVRLWND